MLSSKLMEYVAVARVRASAQEQHEAQTTAEEGDGDNVVGVDKLDRTAGDGGVVRPETVESGDRPETVESCVPAGAMWALTTSASHDSRGPSPLTTHTTCGFASPTLGEGPVVYYTARFNNRYIHGPPSSRVVPVPACSLVDNP